jgi:hypothetical protein
MQGSTREMSCFGENALMRLQVPSVAAAATSIDGKFSGVNFSLNMSPSLMTLPTPHWNGGWPAGSIF